MLKLQTPFLLCSETMKALTCAFDKESALNTDHFLNVLVHQCHIWRTLVTAPGQHTALQIAALQFLHFPLLTSQL